jgi:hypothetical protein
MPGWRLGMREALGVPAAVLAAGFVGYGSLAEEYGLSIAHSVFASVAMRIMIFPGGLLPQSELVDRLAACVLALAAFYAWRRNLFVGVFAGVVVLTLASWARTLG